MAKSYDYLFKLLLVGDSGVGKEDIFDKIDENALKPTFISSICTDFNIRTIELEDKKIKLQLWNTAGHERYKSITTAYYRGAMGIMLVYDITNEKSFENIKNWIKDIKEHAAPDVQMMILGNKCDLNDERVVSKERGEQLALEYGIRFMEVSTKKPFDVEDAFYILSRDIKVHVDKQLEGKDSRLPANSNIFNFSNCSIF